VVPLSEWAIEELQKLEVMAAASRYVLPNADNTAPADPKYITRSVARCLKRFKKHGVAAFTAHDLRRTGRTGLAKLGIKTDIGERVLNHTRERIEATYDVHGYIDEKREALDKWAKYLAVLRDGQRAVPKRRALGRQLIKYECRGTSASVAESRPV
jgi:integrase